MIIETRSSRRGQFLHLGLPGWVLLGMAVSACGGRGHINVGGPCTRDESCTTGVCLRETRQKQQPLWQGGYCSGNCETNKCPTGTCRRLEDGKSYCLSICQKNEECRVGYVCATSVESCLPDCRLGWSCGSSLTCNAQTGTCDPPPMTPAPIGAPCTWNLECISGLCTPEQGTSGTTYWTGGACTLDCNTLTCPTKSTCVEFGPSESFCVASCAANGDCRTGYICATAVGACLPDCRLGWSCGSSLTCNAKTGACELPPVTPGPIGAPCTWNVECVSGLCTPEQGTSGPTYWAGGACTQDCTSADCPTGSTCVTYESGGAFCSTNCATTSDCRTGYVCATSVGACLPDCRLGWSCGSSLACNVKTGACDPTPVTPAPIGAPCTWNVECSSGLCTPEKNAAGPTYWTGGACTQDCTSAPCPTGSTCMSFASAGSFCVASCAASSDCRSSYVCDTDVHGCLPDCRLGWSCGTYFICDGQTGMCVTPPIASPDGGTDVRSSSGDAHGGPGGPGGGGSGGPGPAF